MDIINLLNDNERKDLLRISTAGSVDDGKSTLIGRLLYDSKTIFEDHLKSLERDSVKHGTTGGDIDLALLLDGLKAEREQGITIDVAYRFFSTPRRKFIIADTPGHVQYTRNMATGASTAHLAVILVDISRGVTAQTKRHSFIASLLGIRHIVVAVNKMDMVGYDQCAFEKVKDAYTDFAAKLETRDVHFIPMSALKGDNVVERSENMPWHHGGALLDYLENVHIASDENLIDFRFPVQRVSRPDSSFRGFQGTVASGAVRVGDEVMALPSARRSRVKSIVTFDGDLPEAFPPKAVTITLEDEIDISRGDMLVHVNNAPTVDNQVEAMLVWMHSEPMRVGGRYLMKHTSATVPCAIERCLYRMDVENLHRQQADSLALNEIGRVKCRLAKPLFFDPYTRNRATGSFILIDPVGNSTMAAGMILQQRSSPTASEGKSAVAPQSLRPSKSLVSTEAKAAAMNQQPFTLWLTGLPCAGKSTLAYALEKRLFDLGRHAIVLDSAVMRSGISSNLGFSGDERSENRRRTAATAKLLNDNGLIAIVALVSPFSSDRGEARSLVGAERFLEVHVDASAEAREARDTEGMYAAARTGDVKFFSGVSAPYEPPLHPDVLIDTTSASVESCVDKLMSAINVRIAVEEAS